MKTEIGKKLKELADSGRENWEVEYKKLNPQKIWVTIDKVENGYHIQAWHNGIVLTGHVSKNNQLNKRFLKDLEHYSGALLAEIVYQK